MRWTAAVAVTALIVGLSPPAFAGADADNSIECGGGSLYEHRGSWGACWLSTNGSWDHVYVHAEVEAGVRINSEVTIAMKSDDGVVVLACTAGGSHPDTCDADMPYHFGGDLFCADYGSGLYEVSCRADWSWGGPG